MAGEDKNFLIGFIVGVMLTALFWWLIADKVEKYKVSSGYLTFKNKTYTVTLYDTLDTPEKDNENDNN